MERLKFVNEGNHKSAFYAGRNDKGSLALKGLLLFAFVFIYGILLLGDTIAYVHFLIPNCVIFLVILFLFLLVSKFKIKEGHLETVLERHENACLLVSSILVLVVQFFITYSIIFRTSWDVEAVWYGAHWVALGDATGLQEMSEYYSIYPNNLLLVFIFSRILKLNQMLGEPISNGGLLLALIQCAVVTFTGAVMFKCVKRFVGIRTRWGTYILYVLLVALSPWIVLPYSDGMGIVFPVLLLYLYLRCKEHAGAIGKILCVYFLFAIAVVAYHIKPYSVIVIIAASVIEVFEWLVRIVRGELHIKIMDAVVVFTALVAFICSATFVSHLNHSMGFHVDEERGMGVSHYLMMGVNENTTGGFSAADLEFSEKIYDKDRRTDAELNEFRQRIHNLGFAGYAALFVRKAAKNFCDGTFGWGTVESFYTEVYPSRGQLSDLLRSWYYGYEELYPYNALLRQCLWVFVLVSIPFVVLTCEALDAKKKVLILSMLGFMLYLQIFESHSRYVFVFVPLFLIISAVGTNNIVKRWFHVENGEAKE